MPPPPQPYIKPAPIPSLPPTYQQGRQTPQPGQIRQRGVIQRNPTPAAPTPNVPRPGEGEEEAAAIVPRRRPRCREFDPGRPSTKRTWWGSFDRESDKRTDYPRDLLELPP